MRERRILFAGAYGIENAGDDLPLVVMCRSLKKLDGRTKFEFRALSRHPNRWEEREYGVRMIKNIEHDTREESIGRWFKGLNYGDDKKQLFQVISEIKKCDLMILGAGNFLFDLTIDLFRGPVPLFALYVFLAKLYHKRVMLYGLSAGPLKTELGRELARYIVENADIVTVRDKESKMLLDRLTGNRKKITVLPDSTMGGMPSDSQRTKRILVKEGVSFDKGRKRIALGLRDLGRVLPHEQSESILKEILFCINSLKGTCEFVFLPQSTHKQDDDRLLASNLAKKLDNGVKFAIVKNRYHPEDLMGLYSHFDATLSIRLHSAVFSILAGTPAVAINYLPKVEGFMNALSLRKLLVNYQSIRGETIVQRLDDVLEDKRAFSDRIRPEVEARRRMVSKYGELALSLL